VGNLPLFESLAKQAADLPPSVRTVAVVLQTNDWLAPYFRLPGQRRIRLVSMDLVKSRYNSPADFLRRAGFDALITQPDLYSAGTWPGIESRQNDQGGVFARVGFFRTP
jgi:hypothetical protein